MTDHLRNYQFRKGDPKRGGRKVGVRNKLSDKFLKDLHNEWQRSGEAALKILAKEDPASFAKLALGVIPKEHDHEGMPSIVVLNTGVERAPGGPGGSNSPPALPAPRAALPAPKKEEPAAQPCPLSSADMVAELPKAPEPAKAQPAMSEPVRPQPIEYEFNPPWR